MLCVSLAVICDWSVEGSRLNGWLSYPGGLIIFNPLDELRPNLHTGGQSLPIRPNIQSIIVFNKVSFIFFNTREFIHGMKPKRISTQENNLGFCKHSTKRGHTLPTSLSCLLLLLLALISTVCQSFSQSFHHRVGRHKSHVKAHIAEEGRA